MNFASDNATEIAPEIMDAITGVNSGFAPAYGNDDLTKKLERRMSEVFEREVATFVVATGTAANALAIAHCCQPWSAVLCHEASHLMTDEAGAPEFFGQLSKRDGGRVRLDPTSELHYARAIGHVCRDLSMEAR